MTSERVTDFFLPYLPPDAFEEVQGHPNLAQLLGEHLKEVESVWPQISLEHRIYLSFLAKRFLGLQGLSLEERLEQMPSRDLYLACACIQGDPIAIQLFEEHYFVPAGMLVSQFRLSDTQLHEIQQHMRELLFVGTGEQLPRLTQYNGKGQLVRWVRVVTTRELFRMMKQDKQESPYNKELLEKVEAPQKNAEVQFLKVHYAARFKKAFYQALEALESKERNILRYYHLEGLNIDAIGDIFSVHRSTVARWINKIQDTLLSETKQFFKKELQVEQKELESIMLMIRSQMELTIQRFFSGDSPTP